MVVGSKAKSTFLSGIALCVISGLLLVIGVLGSPSSNFDVHTTYFFVPLLFFVTGIIAIVMSIRKTRNV
jgi:hypothetical protein